MQPVTLPTIPGPEAVLEEKAAFSERLLRGLALRADPAAAAVAFTGGKDSMVALILWLTVLRSRGLAPVRALSIDTGLKFPETTAFRDKLAADMGVDLIIARPTANLDVYPVAMDKTACCGDLKIRPLKAALAEHGVRLLITGVRRDEHESRRGRPHLEQREDPPHLLVHPLLDWTEMDVWAFIAQANLPYCPLYDQGYRSLGCMPCTEKAPDEGPERAGRDPDKERVLSTLHDLGYF